MKANSSGNRGHVMEIQVSAALQKRHELADVVRQADSILMEMLPEGSKLGAAFWDLCRDVKGREIVTLEVRDPWGAATGYYTPDELKIEQNVRQQLKELVGKLVKGSTPQQQSLDALLAG